MTLDYYKIADLAIKLFAVVGFGLAFLKYRESVKQKRLDVFLDMWDKYITNERFKRIMALLEQKDQGFEKISLEDKLEFIGYNEQVALMVEKKYMSKNDASDFFGYYAIKAFENENLNKEFKFDNMAWERFRKFAVEMKKIRQTKQS